MRKISFFLLFFIILLMDQGCLKKDEWRGKILYKEGVKTVKNPKKGVWEESKSGKKIIFNEVLSVGSSGKDENEVFYHPMDAIADDEGNIYVLDSGNNRIQKFDRNGDYLLTIGKRGQGPGEISRSMDIELDSQGNILVIDTGNARVTTFNPQGKFLYSFHLNFLPFRGTIDSEDNIYIHSQHKDKLIHKFNRQGQYLFSFLDKIKSEIPELERQLNHSGRIGCTNDDKIFLVLPYPYTIFIHNKKGELIEKIESTPPYARPPRIVPPDSSIVTDFMISGIGISPHGHIFCRNVSVEMPDRIISLEEIRRILSSLYKEHSYVDLYDSDGRFLIHQKTDNFSWGGFFDKKGYYYGIEEAEDYFRAVKYSIQFKN